MAFGALFAIVNQLFFGLSTLVVSVIVGAVSGLVAGIMVRRESKIKNK
jgi:ABC-type dipeptide/oligopeptide/nickel transport system permease subunit